MELTQEEMNLVYPQTNNDWANEVGTSFFADSKDLDRNGWYDPWGRPVPKWEFLADISNRPNYSAARHFTHLLYKDNDEVVELTVYTRLK
jgi:hypothetical protein